MCVIPNIRGVVKKRLATEYEFKAFSGAGGRSCLTSWHIAGLARVLIFLALYKKSEN